MNYYWDKMIELDADGIDFIPIWFEDGQPPILESYTRREFQNVQVVPKSDYHYCKLVDGQKVYIY